MVRVLLACVMRLRKRRRVVRVPNQSRNQRFELCGIHTICLRVYTGTTPPYSPTAQRSNFV